jgi:hypothetical protein
MHGWLPDDAAAAISLGAPGLELRLHQRDHPSFGLQ